MFQSHIWFSFLHISYFNARVIFVRSSLCLVIMSCEDWYIVLYYIIKIQHRALNNKGIHRTKVIKYKNYNN